MRPYKTNDMQKFNMTKKSPSASSEYQHKHYLENRQYYIDKAKKYWATHKISPEYYKHKMEQYHDYYLRNRSQMRMRARNYAMYRNQQIKFDVLLHYSNGATVPTCQLCGYTNITALSIDHINGGGCQHRRDLKGISSSFYRILQKTNYPEGYRTLCMNCQFIKRAENRKLKSGGK